jgi:hypothetical protein
MDLSDQGGVPPARIQVASRHKDSLLQSSCPVLQSSAYPLCQGAKTDCHRGVGLTLRPSDVYGTEIYSAECVEGEFSKLRTTSAPAEVALPMRLWRWSGAGRPRAPATK